MWTFDDIETLIALYTVLFPIILPPLIVSAMIVITIVKALRGDLDAVLDNQKVHAAHRRKDQERGGRHDVRYDGIRGIFAIRNKDRRFGFWFGARNTQKQDAEIIG